MRPIFPGLFLFHKFGPHFGSELPPVDFVTPSGASELGVFRECLAWVVFRTIEGGHERVRDEEVVEFRRAHFAYSLSRDRPAVHGVSARLRLLSVRL